MKKFTTAILFFCFSYLTVQATPDMSVYEAINKAGYQRMLTQRVAKCYMSIVANVEAEKHKTYLKGSSKSFEDNLNELKNYAPTDKIKDQFRYVEILWRNYKFIYTDNYTKENAVIILSFNNKILTACHEAVLLLEEYAIENKSYGDQESNAGDQELAQVINLSGKQRMLTQRIALYALAKSYKMGDQVENIQMYNEAVTDFNTGYRKLMACPKNTAQIDEEYNNVSKSWEASEATLQEIMAASEMSTELKDKLSTSLDKMDFMLFAFDEIVFLYERQKN